MRADIFQTDVVVIGGGAAAARAAIAAAEAGVDVVVVSKSPVGKSGASAMAEGGIAAAIGHADPADSPQAHYEDTLAAGRGLTNRELARINVEEAPARIQDLVDYEVDFRRKGDRLSQGQPPGHSYPRSLTIAGGGVGVMNPLRRKMLSYPNLHLYEDTMAVRLFTDSDRSGDRAGDRVIGALCLDIAKGDLAAFAAGATIVATGGYQELYPLSSASHDLTGDGYALALAVGAELVDMEIVLYYPTVLLSPPSLKGTIILYEFFLHGQGGAGARLVNVDDEDLLDDYDTLPVRDELSRRILDEVRRGKGTERGGVFVDVSRSSVPLAKRRETVKRVASYTRLTAVGFDVAASKFEIAPAAHTVLGGIRINSLCETNVPGLYAAGEAAGNVHGANRLAGNALTDTQTFGYRAGRNAAEFAKQGQVPHLSDEKIAEAAQTIKGMLEPKADSRDASKIKNTIQKTMFQYVGPTRTEEGTTTALDIVERILHNDIPLVQARSEPGVYNYSLVEALEADLMARTAIAVCHAARLRRESRGHHYRSDYPAPDTSRPPQHTLISLRNDEIAAQLYQVS